jgi:hypothetical protein
VNAAHTVIEPICHVQSATGVPHCRRGLPKLRQGANGVHFAPDPAACQGAHCPSGERKGANAMPPLLHHIPHCTASVQGNVCRVTKLRGHPNAISSAVNATTRQGGDHARGQDSAHAVVAKICHKRHPCCICLDAIGTIKGGSSAQAICKPRAPRASKSAHQASWGDAPHAVPAEIAHSQAQRGGVYGHAHGAIELRCRAQPVHPPRHPTPRQRARAPVAGRLRGQAGHGARRHGVAGHTGRSRPSAVGACRALRLHAAAAKGARRSSARAACQRAAHQQYQDSQHR